jgi:molybdopterin/thiamine biosynthesis adenylyltransferase
MTDRLDRQRRIDRWDQARISNTTLAIHIDNAAYHIVFDALVRGCMMIGFEKIIIIGDKSWNSAIRDLQHYGESISSFTEFHVIQKSNYNPSLLNQCSVVVSMSNKKFFPFWHDNNPARVNFLCVDGAATDEKITWFAEVFGEDYFLLPEYVHLNGKAGVSPGSALSLILAGSTLAEVIRRLVPLERWNYSDLYMPAIFPLQNENMTSPQDQHKKPVMAIVGAGGIGSWFMYALQSDPSILNAEHIYIIDDDMVDMTNLNRQVLYTKADIGHYKAETLKNKVKWLSGVKITAINERIEKENFFECKGISPDIIFSCLDAWQPRHLLNEIAKKSGALLVNAGCDPFSVNAYSYQRGVTPCLDCAMDISERAAIESGPVSCAMANPSVVFTNMIAAGMMLHLMHSPRDSINGILNYDLTIPERIGFVPFTHTGETCNCA